MTPPRPFRPVVDGAIALAAVLYATAPLWRMGWLRDDWLLLWSVLDPATAPAGADGVFPRPVAGLLWTLSGAVAGDAPWAMHVLIFLAWFFLVAGAIWWHRRFGGGHGGALVVALALATHGALVEPRLWAAAGNGVLAAALAVWGGCLLVGERPLAARLGGAALVILAVLARADAAVLLVLPAVASSGSRRPVGLPLASLAGFGAVLLAWMVAFGGGWAVRPADGGHLLRLLLVPWGPPLPTVVATVGGVLGIVVAVGAGRLLAVAAPRAAAFLLAAGAVALAGSAVDWTAAGRYVLMPAIPLALALGAWWDGYARGGPATGGQRVVRLAIGGWILLGLVAVPAGGSGRDLLIRSGHETSLYRAMQVAGPLDGDHLTVLNPPPVGWSESAADLENVVSAALRRPVVVSIGTGGKVSVPYPAAVWSRGAWRVWTDQPSGGRQPHTR